MGTDCFTLYRKVSEFFYFFFLLSVTQFSTASIIICVRNFIAAVVRCTTSIAGQFNWVLRGATRTHIMDKKLKSSVLYRIHNTI